MGVEDASDDELLRLVGEEIEDPLLRRMIYERIAGEAEKAGRDAERE